MARGMAWPAADLGLALVVQMAAGGIIYWVARRPVNRTQRGRQPPDRIGEGRGLRDPRGGRQGSLPPFSYPPRSQPAFLGRDRLAVTARDGDKPAVRVLEGAATGGRAPGALGGDGTMNRLRRSNPAR